MKKDVFTISSFKDAGYKAARSSETMASIAKWVTEQNPNFLDSPTDEQKADLRDGWALRWQELHPASKYTIDWVPSDKGNIEVTLAYCYSYSQQAFGQLKNENPVQHSVIADIRTKFNKYASNRMKELCAAIRANESEGKVKPKAATKDYATFLKDMFDGAKSRCKTATARGDETAPSEIALRQAIDAFYARLK
jgi:hypothetical protein